MRGQLWLGPRTCGQCRRTAGGRQGSAAVPGGDPRLCFQAGAPQPRRAASLPGPRPVPGTGRRECAPESSRVVLTMTLQGQRCPHAAAEAQSTAGHLTTLPRAPRLTRGHALHFSARNRVLDRNEAFPPGSPRSPMAVRPSSDIGQGLCGCSDSYPFLKCHFIAGIEHPLLGTGYINSGNKYLPADSPVLGKADMPGARQPRCARKDGGRSRRGTV